MSDELRGRAIRVIDATFPGFAGASKLADELIAGLRLRQERHHCPCDLCSSLHRFVTDWMLDG